MKKIDISSEPVLLNQIIEGLGQAEGACSQLIHIMENPVAWMTMREALELAKEGVVQVATFQTTKITAKA